MRANNESLLCTLFIHSLYYYFYTDIHMYNRRTVFKMPISLNFKHKTTSGFKAYSAHIFKISRLSGNKQNTSMCCSKGQLQMPYFSRLIWRTCWRWGCYVANEHDSLKHYTQKSWKNLEKHHYIFIIKYTIKIFMFYFSALCKLVYLDHILDE